MSIHVTIQTQDFDVSHEVHRLRAGRLDIGGIVTFIGSVRQMLADLSGHEGQSLELEHYPEMTERALVQLAETAQARFDLSAVRILHRVGRLMPGEQIVLVVAAAQHRQQAFLGCEFLIDQLKTQAPFWKKEITPLGATWVAARSTDERAAERWLRSEPE